MRFAFACLSCFAALAIAVALGAFTGLDQWAVAHVMPGRRFTGGEPSLLDALIPLAGTHWSSAWSVLVNVVTLPASLLVAPAVGDAVALVEHRDLERGVAVLQDDLGRGAAGVLHGVGQRFLHAAVRGEVDPRREWVRLALDV